MSSRPRRSVVAATALALVAGFSAAGASASTAPAGKDTRWNAAWAAAPQRPSIGFVPNWAEAGFDRHTLRQVVRVTQGGDRARIRLSNAYGASPLRIAGATVARTEGTKGAAVAKGTLRRLTFGGERAVTIPAGGQLSSDAAALGLDRFDSVTVTLRLAGTTGPATFHAQSFATSYRATGDHLTDTGGGAFDESTESWYYLAGVDVRGERPARRDGIVLFGDSITDGFGSSPDHNRRWSDALAERLAKAGTPRPVVNSGIGGNLVLNDSAWFGDKSSTRFARDVTDLPNAGTVVVLEGVNDIGFSETDKPTYKPAPVVTARELINGHRKLIRAAHAKGLKVVGATLVPFGGSDHYGERAAAVSDAFNTWVRTSGAYDGYVDFDQALADPADPERIRPAYDSGDHLHPNDAGYRAMARAVDLKTL
ncbi:GDSL-like Lipase/Acylhydrolase [Streptomyces sp. YIM 121038]|uniref:SGNH/GDSL hydrolase family protein n=1 Tax=Streptomyces sp. YIM 121038 TaxID=2136401 RepID=UPI001110E076|nr:SGNH/GDSL hydrolase family protein [Streptomyces sp. YIM 121038]QCX78005.1 GDSL-like Lipase/Acylhydrolase [Streptomyces sp. YIM 121038]